jgi:hypothetical protein
MFVIIGNESQESSGSGKGRGELESKARSGSMAVNLTAIYEPIV